MHAGAVASRLGLRHKSGMKAVTFCDGLYRQLKGHNIIRRFQGVIISEIYLMLCRSRFMMGGFNNKSHIL